MKTIGYMYAEDRELKMLRPMFFLEPQNAPEGFSEVQLVRRDDAEREIELLRNVMRKAIAALEAENAKQAERIRQLENAVKQNDETAQHYLAGRTEALLQLAVVNKAINDVAIPALSQAARLIKNPVTDRELIEKAVAQIDAIIAKLKGEASWKSHPYRECEYCDGTGDVHDRTGEWRGTCTCEAGKRISAPDQRYDGVSRQPRLIVRVVSFAESNGKRNWTALLTRIDKWDGLIGNCGGITVAHSEFWNRVAYEAERTKFLIGERDTEPFILDYGKDICTPEEWSVETRLAAADKAMKGEAVGAVEAAEAVGAAGAVGAVEAAGAAIFIHLSSL